MDLWQQAGARVLVNRAGADAAPRPAATRGIGDRRGEPRSRPVRPAGPGAAGPGDPPPPRPGRGRTDRGGRPRRHLGVLLPHRRPGPPGWLGDFRPVARRPSPATARCSPALTTSRCHSRSTTSTRPRSSTGRCSACAAQTGARRSPPRTGWSAAVRVRSAGDGVRLVLNVPLLGGGRLPSRGRPACRVRLPRHLRRGAGRAVPGNPDAAGARATTTTTLRRVSTSTPTCAARCANSVCCMTATPRR